MEAEIRLATAVAEEQKLINLFQYTCLFETIKPYFATTDTDSEPINALIRNTIYFLCNKINESSENISKSALYYFCRVCTEQVSIYPSAFNDNFNFMMHSFVQKLSREKDDSIKLRLKTIIQSFMTDWSHLFKQKINLLPDFPNTAEFTDLQSFLTNNRNENQQNTLSSNICNFLKIEYVSEETLNSLFTILSSKKGELVEIYRNAETFRFSDEAETSNLHRLIMKLLSIIQGNENKNSYQAARCLGELGASNFYTMSLTGHNDNMLYYIATDTSPLFYDILLRWLKAAIVDDNFKIKEVANALAFDVFQSKIGRTFLSKNPIFNVYLTNTEPKYMSILNMSSLNPTSLTQLFVPKKKTYKSWSQAVCGTIVLSLECDLLFQLVQLAPDLAGSLIPVLVQVLLGSQDPNMIETLNNEIKFFFEKSYTALTNAEGDTDDEIFKDKSVIKIMLLVFECCRIKSIDSIAPTIKPDYFHLVKAAEYCEAYYSAILYVELWSSNEAIKINQPIFVDPKCNVSVSKTLINVYEAVGIDDMVSYLVDPVNDYEKYLTSNNMWSRILLELDTKDASQTSSSLPLIQSGLYNLAHFTATDNTAVKYETAWRLCDWSHFASSNKDDTLEISFEKHHYEAIKRLHLNDENGIKVNVEKARWAIVNTLKNNALECSKSLYPLLGCLERLQQIEDISDVRFFKNEHEQLVAKWEINDKLPLTDFSLTELKFSQRMCLLKGTGVRAGRSWVPLTLQSTVSNIIDSASKANMDNIVIRNLEIMKTMSLDLEYKGKMLLANAKLSWKHGDHKLARSLLRHLNQTIDQYPPTIQIETLQLLGQYSTGDIFNENPEEVFIEYFRKAEIRLKAYAKQKNRFEKAIQGEYDNDKVGKDLKGKKYRSHG